MPKVVGRGNKEKGCLQRHFLVRFSFASGVLECTTPTILQWPISGQSPQVTKPLLMAHLRISHRVLQ